MMLLNTPSTRPLTPLERAVEGIRAGATDFIAKPVNADAVVALVERAIAEETPPPIAPAEVRDVPG